MFAAPVRHGLRGMALDPVDLCRCGGHGRNRHAVRIAGADGTPADPGFPLVRHCVGPAPTDPQAVRCAMSLRILPAGVPRQFAVFVVGGLLSAGVDIGCMMLALKRIGDPVLAATVGFVASLSVNYLFHAKLPFATKTTAASAAKYLSIVGINYLIT